MNRYLKHLWIVIVVVAWSCGKDEPNPANSFPSYLRVPANLEGYEGSGLITVDALNLRAEGPEQLNPTTKTYSGVLGSISTNEVEANFTVGQPNPYEDSNAVPEQYKANGVLTIIRALSPGTYPLNAQTPTPKGEFADITLQLPGPQIYFTQGGNLTIDEATLVKTEASRSLYRIKGSFQAEFLASGVGIVPGKPITSTGSFDLLLVR